MAKSLIRLAASLAILGLLTMAGLWKLDFARQHPLADAASFPNAAQVVTDVQKSVYAIEQSRTELVKMSWRGTLQYVLLPLDTHDDRVFYKFVDETTDEQGRLYVLEALMDVNGRAWKGQHIVRYTADGQLDESFVPVDEPVGAGDTPTEQHTIKSMQVQDGLLVLGVASGDQLLLKTVDGKSSKAQEIYRAYLPPDTYVDDMVGTSKDNLLYSTKRGDLHTADGTLLYPQPGMPTDGIQIYPQSLKLDSTGQSVFFLDRRGEVVNQIHLSTPNVIKPVLTLSTLQADLKAMSGGTDYIGDEVMSSLDLANDGQLLIAINDHALWVTPDKSTSTYGEPELLTYSLGMKAIEVAYWVGAALAVLLLLYAAKILYFEIMPYKLLLKQVLLWVPVLVIGMGLLSFIVYEQFSDAINKEVQRGMIFMAHDGQNLIDGNKVEALNGTKDYMSQPYQDIRQKLLFNDHFQKFYVSIYKYYRASNKLYSVYDTEYSMFEPFDPDHDPVASCTYRPNDTDFVPVANGFRQVLDKGQYLTCQSSDTDGNWLYSVGPVYDSHKQIVGMYETGINMYAYSQRLATIRGTIYRTILGVTLGMVAVFLLVIFFLLANLKKLRSGVTEFAKGRLDVEVQIKAVDEVGELGRLFTEMAKSIKGLMEKMKLLNESNARFVPQSVLESLDKRDITEVERGDHVKQEMTVLVANIRDFYKLSSTMSPEDNFHFINEFLEEMCPVIRENGGMVSQYLAGGMLALFPNGPADALKAAVDLRTALQTYNEQRLQKGLKTLDIGIGLHKGSLMLGIIGEAERLESQVISDDVNFAMLLEKTAATLGAQILLPAAVMQEVGGLNQGLYRTLGRVEIDGVADAVELIDLFAGDEDETAKRKAKTKKLFEEGIVMFQNGRFFDARERFLEVIRQNPKDAAAKLYFYLSDDGVQNGARDDFQGTLPLRSSAGE